MVLFKVRFFNLMKVRELNRKIFYNASQVGQEDYLELISDCYEKTMQRGGTQQQMDTCL